MQRRSIQSNARGLRGVVGNVANYLALPSFILPAFLEVQAYTYAKAASACHELSFNHSQYE